MTMTIRAYVHVSDEYGAAKGGLNLVQDLIRDERYDIACREALDSARGHLEDEVDRTRAALLAHPYFIDIAWDDYAEAVRALPPEAKDRLRAAPPERWLGAVDAANSWYQDGAYRPSALAAASLTDLDSWTAEPPSIFLPEMPIMKIRGAWRRMTLHRPPLERAISESAYTTKLTGAEFRTLTLEVVR